ncbi:MAG: glycosyltransferase [Candidatus Woesebacteria bacterium]|nr:MAG: glycosyltransferase [Candidatus Woesebacteria bacterium]
MLNNTSQILIATFSPWKNGKRMPTNGMVEPLVEYFSTRYKSVYLLDQPHPGSDILMPRIEVYKYGKLKKVQSSSFLISALSPLLAAQNVSATQVSFKLRDFLSVIDLVIGQKLKIDLFIGFESVNAIAGIFLKKVGFIKKVVYYVSDFSPKRYKSKWFNKFYLFLDKTAARYSDATWNVSEAMPAAREKLGYNMKDFSPQILAPNAFFRKEIKFLPLDKTKPFSIIYAGTLGLENGPDLAIQMMPQIIRRFPSASLTVAGGGRPEDEKLLKNLIKKLNLEKSINFVGFVPSNKELYSLVRKHRLLIAPYKAIRESVRWYADAVKIRMALACGLPVVTTQVPPNGKLAEKAGAGIITKDNPKDLANVIINIFSNKKTYLKMRKAAISAAKENTWENSYSSALNKMDLTN